MIYNSGYIRVENKSCKKYGCAITSQCTDCNIKNEQLARKKKCFLLSSRIQNSKNKFINLFRIVMFFIRIQTGMSEKHSSCKNKETSNLRLYITFNQ